MKHFKIILFSLIALLAVGCEDFLEADIRSSQTADEYCTDATSINAALNGAYYSCSNLAISGHNAAVIPTDLMKRASWSTESGCWNYTFTAQTSKLTTIWTTHYTGIKNCNYVIQSIMRMEDGEETYRSQLAQARGIRGYFYFNLLRNYGELPLMEVVPELSDEQMNPERASMYETIDFIIEDFKYAALYALKESDSGYSFGRFNQNTALGFLAKLHLYVASISDRDDTDYYYEDIKEHYKLSMDYVRRVIESGAYSLVDYYPDLFSWRMEDTARQEVMFGAVHNHDAYTGGSVGRLFGLPGDQTYGASQGMVTSTKYQAMIYEPSDSTRRLWNCPNAMVIEATDDYPNGTIYSFDYDKYCPSGLTSAYALVSNGSSYNSESVSIYSFGKFRRFPLDNADTYSVDAFGMDQPILRFADLLLIYAESYNEYYGDPGSYQASAYLSMDGSNIGSAYDAVNLVRKRARTYATGDVHADATPRTYKYENQDYYDATMEIEDNNYTGGFITEAVADGQTPGCVPDWKPGFYGYKVFEQGTNADGDTEVKVVKVYEESSYTDDYTAFRIEILNERARELVCEQNDRWFDLTRRNRLKIEISKVTSMPNPMHGNNNQIEDFMDPSNIRTHMVRLPIPSSELDANPNLYQNPGYN